MQTLSGDCNRRDASGSQHSTDTELLTPSPLSTASLSSPPETGFESDVVRPAAQDDIGDLFSADALLFLLEEEQEELVLPGLPNEPLTLANLDFLKAAAEEERDGAINSRRHVAIAPAPCVPINSPATPAKNTAAAPKAATGGRKRVKDELEYLRQNVSDLEDQLRELTPSNPHADRDDLSLATPSHPTLVVSSSSLWKRVAANQLDERKKAEVENTRLRNLLEGQLRIARSLAKTLRNRMVRELATLWRQCVSDLDSVRPKSANEVCRIKRADQDAATQGIFAYLEETIDPLYNCVDAVLIEAGFSSSEREVQDNQVKTDAMGRLFLEVVDSNVFPFDLETTSASIWKLFSHSSNYESLGDCSLQAIDATSDTLITRFSKSLPLRRIDTVVLDGHMLGRRFIEENRVVTIWSSLGKSKSNLFGSEPVVIRETGWTVIEAIPSDDGGVSTIIQTVVRLTPDLGDLDLDPDSVSESQSIHVGVLTELVLGSFRQNFGVMHRMVESIIMAEMTAPKVCS